MSELFHQLGIDWRLLAGQVVNFALLLVILRAVVYKPIIRILAERRAKIEDGLAKAREADARLAEIQSLVKSKLREAEHAALGLLKETEERAKEREEELLAQTKRKEEEIMKRAELLAQNKQDESMRRLEQEAARLVRNAIEKTVELSPKSIDDALIEKAVKELRHAQ